jgi:hypothetical protein
MKQLRDWRVITRDRRFEGLGLKNREGIFRADFP